MDVLQVLLIICRPHKNKPSKPTVVRSGLRPQSFFFFICLLATTLSCAGKIRASSIPVYLIGKDEALRERIFLTPDIQAAANIDRARVIVIHNITPPESERDGLIEQVREGKGLIILMGPEVEASFLGELYGGTVELETRDNALTVKFCRPAPGFWQELYNRIRGKEAEIKIHWSQAGKVDWSSLPRVYDRMAPVKSPSLGALLALDDTSAEGVLYEGRVGKGRATSLRPGSMWTPTHP